ncbi:MAG: calcium-translocating P-type ATPase, PMCA-type [Oscillospiraceae bacterium]|nr:calcium-translocating P-type ATPase, PMCA-type [Oscillospiraceae bacterium]
MIDFLTQIEQLKSEFNTDFEKGLSPEQVEKNAAEYGKNELTKERPESLFKRVWAAMTEPMLLLLIGALGIAILINVISAFTGDGFDVEKVVGIFAAIALSVVITVVMEGKSAKAFEALSKINDNITVKVLRNSQTIICAQKDIVVGDVILLATGDKIPADGRLLESSGLSADESSLTGESVPVEKDADAKFTDEKTPLAERKNMLYSGTYITGGFCKLLVCAVGNQTEFGKIAKELTTVGSTTTPLQEKLSRMGKIVAILGVIAAALVFIVRILRLTEEGLHLPGVLDAFLNSIVLIVAAIPEGLPTIVAVSLSINIIKLAKQNALVKKLIACETIGCVNVICSDKTGTLTENRMTVISLSEPENEFIIKNICINSTADVGDGGEFIGNPTECAMLVAADKHSSENYATIRNAADVVRVFPFSSEHKNMSTVTRQGANFTAYSKGSPEKIFECCNITSRERSEFEALMVEEQKKARRVIAFAHRILEADSDCKETVEKNMTFDGFVAIADPIRADVYESAEHCRAAGIEIKMLTGDNILTATAIANELKLLEGERTAVEATHLESLSDDELSVRLKNISVIARSTPTIKMRVVKLLKEQGDVVAVTGDGINDAPAIKNADVGIAMGITGTEVSKEASDIVLLNDSFTTIVKAIEWGRGIYENFKRFISFQLTVNVSSVIVVLGSALMGWQVPLTALQLLWINIIMDGPPALSIGLEPVSKDLMQRQPVRRSENIINAQMLKKILLTAVFISSVFLLQHSSFNFLGADEQQAPGVRFALFSLFILFNAFNSRVLTTDSIFKTFLNNKLALATIFSTIVLQVVIIQFAGTFFGVSALPLEMWVKIFCTAFSVIVLSELIKLFKRILNP